MNIRVLLADDFPLMLDALERALARDPGIDVVGRAEDGGEAVALATDLRPDVVVLDLRMPVLSGMCVLERLSSALPDCRAVVLTATRRADRMLDALAAGAMGYLLKDASGEEVRQAVITVHGGGTAIAPTMAPHVVHAYRRATRAEAPARHALTEREQEVIRLVALGWTDDEIAGQLFLSRRTVQNHLAGIRVKTGLRRRAELARWASEHGWA
jgi:DNA-binding NarL/FixJ family response regulator